MVSICLALSFVLCLIPFSAVSLRFGENWEGEEEEKQRLWKEGGGGSPRRDCQVLELHCPTRGKTVKKKSKFKWTGHTKL